MARGPIRIGIGGWSYAPWHGPFYPDDLKKGGELAFAAGRLSAIEINATFHRTQSPETYRKWAATVPDGFRFAVKAIRFATTRRVLADAGESVGKFLGSGLGALGDRLGPVLWQLPATKAFDADDFAAFLDLLPATVDGAPLTHAIEATHASFADPRVAETVAGRGVAMAHVEDNTGVANGIPAPGFAYARFKQSRENEPNGYDSAGLDRIATLAGDWAAEGGDVYLFFIGGDKIRAPAAAQALIARLG